MPTRSNPDSPFVGAQVEAVLGGRVPGTPSTAGKPAAQAAAFGFPAPPSPSAAPAGRPPAQTMPAPAPATPTVPTPAVPTPSAAGPVAQPVGTQAPSSGLATADGGPAAPPAPIVDTQRYREAVVQTRSRLGPIPRVFRHPSLPEMAVEPGRPNYNPFTGVWSD